MDRQLTSVNGDVPTFGDPKTGSSDRVVPLPQVIVDSLAQHLANFPPGRDSLVFTNAHGSPLRRGNFNEMWRRVRDELGQPKLTFHGLRHHYASLLIRDGSR